MLYIYYRLKRDYISFISRMQAARKNYLLTVPAFFYAINNYLKFIMRVHTFLRLLLCFVLSRGAMSFGFNGEASGVSSILNLCSVV